MQLKSLISLKLGTNVGFDERMMVARKKKPKYFIPFKLWGPPSKTAM